jgi:DNA-binding IscR family transcriptional regulator
LRANWQRINQVIHHVLSDLTLADMAQPVLQPVDVVALAGPAARRAGVRR